MSNFHRYLYDGATRRESDHIHCLLRFPLTHDPANRDRIFRRLICMRDRLEECLTVNFREDERELSR